MQCNTNTRNALFIMILYYMLYSGLLLHACTCMHIYTMGVCLLPWYPLMCRGELYAHNIRLDKVYIIGLDSYFSRFVTVLIKVCTELGCVWLLP